MVEFLFKTCITRVNEDNFEEEECCEVKKYRFPKKSDMTAKVSGLHVSEETDDASVSSSIDEVSRGTDDKHISSSSDAMLKVKESIQVSSSLAKLAPSVSSSLRLTQPRKIVVKSRPIKIKKKDEHN